MATGPRRLVECKRLRRHAKDLARKLGGWAQTTLTELELDFVDDFEYDIDFRR